MDQTGARTAVTLIVVAVLAAIALVPVNAEPLTASTNLIDSGARRDNWLDGPQKVSNVFRYSGNTTVLPK